MEIINEEEEQIHLMDEIAEKQVSRRKFMTYAGIFGVSAAVLGTAGRLPDVKKMMMIMALTLAVAI